MLSAVMSERWIETIGCKLTGQTRFETVRLAYSSEARDEYSI